MIERKFSDLSKLTYRIFTIERKVVHNVCLTVFEWTGTFGDGSRGNDDGVFMRVTTLAALSAWHTHGVVFDLRQLGYTWGDKIWETFGRGIDPSGVEDLPYATVISDRCRPGFATCMSIIEPTFDSLDFAVENVFDRAHTRLTDIFADLDSG